MVHTLATDDTPIPDYKEFLAAFKADSLNPKFAADFDKGVNAAIECCDRYAQSGRIAHSDLFHFHPDMKLGR